LSESVLKKRALSDVLEEIRTVYLNDDRPWIIGFSGGKDSTCMVQLVWTALKTLPARKLTKKIYVISSNTLVEAPQIAERITRNLEKMEKYAKKTNIPFGTNLLTPPISNTFWVRLLGLGYPAPTNWFRWCTDMLKISNADDFIKNTASKYGEVVVLLGMRKNESRARGQVMELYKIKDSLLSRHSKFDSTFVYTPIEDFSAEDVWNYLLENKNPWGEENRDLLAMYQDANASECPLVIDTSSTSCGGGRFGCWTCTVVDNQSYLSNMIDNDEKNDWMEVLAELRQELKNTQPNYRYFCKTCKNEIDYNKKERNYFCSCEKKYKNMDDAKNDKKNIQEVDNWGDVRERVRRDGNVTLKMHSDDDGSYTPGPYRMDFRKEFLEKLLLGQKKIQELKKDPDMELILEDEIHEIQRIWRLEHADWTDSAYEIYNKVTGKDLKTQNNEMGKFEKTEQELLEKICQSHKIPFRLVGNLLNLEMIAQGANRRAKIHEKIKHELGKEWRDVDDDKVFKKILKSKIQFKEKMNLYENEPIVKNKE
jgi:DNA sulfur modification protein DndC